ncbi:MAG: hypothetical protein QCH96_03115 [Candidatus Thermoplasmatota archaeon]|nr:hypothetical protein [Candidatus Thermoplasmatota archaeon]
MSQKEDDEKKLERIRKMLDDPHSPLSNQHDERYLATLQRRLTGETTHLHDHLRFPSPSNQDDLTPHVVVHHSSIQKQPMESVETPSEIEEKSREEESVFDDEELFEIEKPDEASIPEFIEVEPVLKKEEEVTTSVVDSPVSDTQKSLEHLPLWHTVEESVLESSPCEEDSSKKVKQKKVRQKKRFPRPFKNSVVKQDAKEPEIWEEECTEEETKVELSLNSKPQEKDGKKKRGIEKVSKKVSFKRFNGNTKNTNKKNKPESSAIEKTVEKEETTKTTSFKQLSEKDRFSYGEYSLYRKQLRIGGKEIRTVHFFSKDAPEDSTPSELPEGYEVKVNEKTGVPYIKKSK